MDRGAWQATVRGEARAALIFSRSLGWKLLPAASRQPGQGPCPVPPTCSTVWLHSAPYPSLCAWQSPQDPTPWVFSCQWRLLVACRGLSSPRASARVLSVWGPPELTRPRWPPSPLPAARCLWAPESLPIPPFPHRLRPAIVIVMSDAFSRAGAPGG